MVARPEREGERCEPVWREEFGVDRVGIAGEARGAGARWPAKGASTAWPGAAVHLPSSKALWKAGRTAVRRGVLHGVDTTKDDQAADERDGGDWFVEEGNSGGEGYDGFEVEERSDA